MIMKLKNVDYIYSQNTPFEKKALDNINLSIQEGEFIGLIGHTGSGKSTLVQHLNGLIKPTSGEIHFKDIDILNKDTNMQEIRQKVGLVFQYPEYQLFEETIYKDIAFGPKNLGLSEEEVDRRVRKAMKLVGLDIEELRDRSPFELSGGQKRRVAIAGVLAMEPELLILDEPTAGLDPKGRDEILSEIENLYKEGDLTIMLVSHSMEDIAELANRVLVMHKGKLVMDGETREIFSRTDELKSLGLGIPQIMSFMKNYKALGHDVKDDILTVGEAKEEILNYLRRMSDA